MTIYSVIDIHLSRGLNFLIQGQIGYAILWTVQYFYGGIGHFLVMKTTQMPVEGLAGVANFPMYSS